MWAPWGPWSDCSASCGTDSVRTRKRNCLNGKFGGKQCPKPEDRDDVNCYVEVITLFNHSLEPFINSFSGNSGLVMIMKM